MSRSGRSGRLVGALLLIQLVLLILPFILVLPLVGEAWMAGAAGAGTRVRAGVLLLFVTAGVTLWITFEAVPAFWQRCQWMAVALLVGAVVFVVLQVIDNTQMLTMLWLAEGQADETAGLAVAATRRWSHVTALLMLDSWLFVFYVTQYRLALVPKGLAALGAVTVMVHGFGVCLAPMLGYPPFSAVAPVLMAGHLGVGGWLAMNGWREAW